MSKRKWKLVRRLVLGALAVLGLGAAVLAVYLARLDPASFREQLQSRLSERLGREVQLNGEMALNVSLWPRIRVQSLQVSNSRWASRPLFAVVGSVEFQVSLPQLLQRHLKIIELRASDVILNLERRSDGEANWSFPLPPPTTTKEVVALRLRRINVSYLAPGEPPRNLSIAALDASLGSDKPLQVSLRGDYGSIPVAIRISGGVLARLVAGQEPWTFTAAASVDDTRLRINGTVFDGLAARQVEASLDVTGTGLAAFRPLFGSLPKVGSYYCTARLRTEPGGIELSFAVNGSDVDLGHSGEADRGDSANLARLSLRAAGTGRSLREWLFSSRWRLEGDGGQGRWNGLPVTLSGLEASVEPGAPAKLRAQGTFNKAPLELAASLAPLRLWASGPGSLTATLTAGALRARFEGSLGDALQGGFRLSAADLQSVGGLFDQRWPAIGPLKVSGSIRQRDQTLTLSGFEAALGGNRLRGHGEIVPGHPLTARATITSGVLQLKELGKLAGAGTAAADSGRGSAPSPPFPERPLAEFPPHNLNLDLAIGNVRLLRGRKTLGEWGGHAAVAPKRIEITALSAQTPAGDISTRITLDARAGPPRLVVSLDARELDLLQALGGATGKAAPKETAAAVDRLSVTAAGTGESLRKWLVSSRWRFEGDGGRGRWKGLPITLSSLEASGEPGAPSQLRAQGTFNEVPLELAASLAPLRRWASGPGSLTASLTADALRARFDGSVSRSAVHGEFRVNAADLRPVARLLDRQWPAIAPLKVSGSIRQRDQTLTFSGIEAALGGNRLTGNGEIVAGHPLTARASITSGVLRLKELGELTGVGATDSGPRSTPSHPFAGRPLAELPPDNIKLDLAFGNVRLLHGREMLGEWRGHAVVTPKRIEIAPLEGQAAAARISTRITLDARARPPRIAVYADLDDVDYGRLLSALEVTRKVTGKLNLSINASGAGDNLQSVLATADGGLRFVGKDGQVPRTLLELWGGSVLQLFNPISWAEGDTVEVRCLVGRFTLTEGVLNSDVLLLDTSRITVAGDLVTDLSTQKLHGRFESRPKHGSLFRLGAPIRIGGTWTNPTAEATESKWVTLGKLLIGLSNPHTIIVLFGDLGTGKSDPCNALLEAVPTGGLNEPQSEDEREVP